MTAIGGTSKRGKFRRTRRGWANRGWQAVAAASVLLLCGAAGNAWLHESFETLDKWTTYSFPGIDKPTTYKVDAGGRDGHVLACVADNSASALMMRREFDVYDYPALEWRWKVANVLEAGDARRKSGDDYPLRVYVMFPFDPEKASWTERAKYRAAKLLYGERPPRSALNYIWANRKQKKQVMKSPYTDRSRLVILQQGDRNVGQWRTERVHILRDYQRAFGEKPPRKARLAIMADADNTGGRSVAYIDYVRVLSQHLDAP